MKTELYIERIGLNPDHLKEVTLPTVRRLQRAHLGTVPFETIRVAGEPSVENHEPEVACDSSTRYEKIVNQNRGGLCYELNGLFKRLLSKLGFDVTRVAGRVFSLNDGSIGPMGGHQTSLLHLDQTYLVEVGFGAELIRTPLPLDGTEHRYPDGKWRAVSSTRTDTDFMIQNADRGTNNWQNRLALQTEPRDRGFFSAAREYHMYAPEAPFNSNPVVTIATDVGYKRLSVNSFARASVTDTIEQSITLEEWYDLLKKEFGIELSPQSDNQ